MLSLVRFVGYTGFVFFAFSEIVDPASDTEWICTGIAAFLTTFGLLIGYLKLAKKNPLDY